MPDQTQLEKLYKAADEAAEKLELLKWAEIQDEIHRLEQEAREETNFQEQLRQNQALRRHIQSDVHAE